MGLWREYTHINASMRVLRLFTLTSGPWLDAIIGGGGGGVFIYSCSNTVKIIAFKRNPSGRTRIYEYAWHAGTGVECRDSKETRYLYHTITNYLQIFLNFCITRIRGTGNKK